MGTGSRINVEKHLIFMNLFSLSCHILLLNGVSGIEEHTHTHPAVPLRPYGSYSSAAMLEYYVPEKAIYSTWSFTTFRRPSDCEERKIVLYLQHGSYPVINPLNESFPENFNTHRTQLKRIDLSLGKNAYTIFYPLPGSWFAAVFIGKVKDDAIGIKGLANNCAYLYSATQVTENLELVEELHMDDVSPVSIVRGSKLQRFFINSNTWRFTITFSNFTHSINNSDRGGPMMAVVRSNALPRNHVYDHYVNCLNQTESCTLTVDSPDTDVWQYVEMYTINDTEVSFYVQISTTECSYVPKWITTPAPTVTASMNGTNTTANISTTTPTAFTTDIPEFTSSMRTSDDVNMTEEVTVGYHTDKVFEYKAGETDVQMLTNHDFMHDLNSEPDQECGDLPELARYSLATRPFFTNFRLQRGNALWPSRFWINDRHTLIVKFRMRPILDTGGTLSAVFALETKKMNISDQEARVDICIRRGGIPVDEQGPKCDTSYHLRLNTSAKGNGPKVMYFPYPEPGEWYISLKTLCYSHNKTTGRWEKALCLDSAPVTFSITVMPCVDGGCAGNNGQCREYNYNIFHYTSCHCVANWRGYGCTDGTHAYSDTVQWVELYFLTLSNLAFIPAIILAVYRHFYAEALVYLFNMFFSAVYHACDGGSTRKYTYCMMPYTVMANGDFYASITSFWVTLIAMSKLSFRVKAFLYMLGGLGLVIGVTWDRTNVWTFMVPFAVALAIMFSCWIYRCYQSKALYPTWRRWLFFLIPGSLLALAGLIIFAGFETTENYKYTHSTWHMCMAFSICFLLPPKPKKEGQSQSFYGLLRTDSDDYLLDPTVPEHEPTRPGSDTVTNGHVGQRDVPMLRFTDDLIEPHGHHFRHHHNHLIIRDENDEELIDADGDNWSNPDYDDQLLT